jgi:DNA helicase-2/ATP-dependent DNA helicase PcrA
MSFLQADGWMVVPLTEFVGNTQRHRAPLILVDGNFLAAPDLQATKAGHSEFWEVKHRSRATVDLVTGVREHWMAESAFRNYHALRVKGGSQVNVILYEGTTEIAGKWLQISVDKMATDGRAGTATNADGNEIAAWFWPVDSMASVAGPEIELRDLADPLLPDEEAVSPIKRESFPPLERQVRRKRSPATYAAEEALNSDINSATKALAERALSSDNTLGLDVLRRKLGLKSLPKYSATFIHPPGAEIEEILGLLQYGIRVFLITEPSVRKSFDNENLTPFTMSRLLEWGQVEVSLESDLRLVDGTPPENPESFNATMLEAEKNGGINFKQYQIVHSRIDQDVLITAGAGTGKTETMSERIVFLLATSQSHTATEKSAQKQLRLDDIALVTFTKQAALEMRSRIGRALMYRLRLAPMCVQPSLAWLMQLSTAEITTIHGFARKIVQNHAADIGIAPSFRVGNLTYELHELVKTTISENLAGLYDRHIEGIQPAHEWVKQVENIWRTLWSNGIDLSHDLSRNLNQAVDWGNAPAPKEGFIADGNQEVAALLHDSVKSMAKPFGDMLEKEQVLTSDQLVPMAIKALRTSNGILGPRYLFIDEFQDTDGLQMEFMLDIRERMNAKLFMVGDAKQAIYRFRGAEGDAFDEMRSRVHKRKMQPIVEYRLTMNFRSTAAILKSLHPRFQQWNLMNLLDYSDNDELVANPLHQLSDTALQVVEISSRERATKVENQVHDWRRLDPAADAAILCRTNKQALTLHQVLRAGGIDCEIVVGGTLFQSPAARELLIYLLAIREPDSTAAILQLSETRWFPAIAEIPVPSLGLLLGIEKWPDERISLKPWGERLGTIATGSLDNADTLMLGHRLELLRRRLSQMSALDFIALSYASLRPTEVEIGILDESERRRYRRCADHIVSLLDSAFSDSAVTIDQVINWLQLNQATNNHEDEPIDKEELLGKITVLTVHKAKGLEFDKVLVPHTETDFVKRYPIPRTAVIRSKGGAAKLLWEWPASKTKLKFTNVRSISEWHAEDDEVRREETRLLYVALTRAKSELLVFVPRRNQTSTKPNNWADLINQGSQSD